MAETLVLDTSALMQAVISDTYTKATQLLLKRLWDDDPLEVYILEFTLVECTNVVWKHIQRQGITKEQALAEIKRLIALPLNIHPSIDLLPRSLEIANQSQLAVYDAVYVALAERYQLTLVTVDEKQSAAAQQLHITVYREIPC